MAGRVLRSEDGLDLVESFAWLQAGRLSSKAVRNVIAAQEGCLITRVHPTCKGNGPTVCRACGKSPEYIEHVLTGCSKWLPTLYIDRHDAVARNIYYRLCIKYKLKPPHYSQRVESVLENDQVRLLWGQPIQTKAIVRHHKPDIVIFETTRKKCTVIEVAVSWFTGMKRQIDIKTNRYCVNGNWEDDLALPYPRGDNLLRELTNLGWKTTFLPIIVGACGEVFTGMRDRLMKDLDLTQRESEDCIERMERSAVLGTSRIIQNHLGMG